MEVVFEHGTSLAEIYHTLTAITKNDVWTIKTTVSFELKRKE